MPENITHPEMVKKLVKNGQDIIKEATANNMHLLHMAVGIAGEVGEILEAVVDFTSVEDVDIENIKEELGDMEFYLEGYRQGIHIERNKTLPKLTRSDVLPGKSITDVHNDLVGLMVASTTLLDATKKIAMYKKDPDMQKILWAFIQIEFYLKYIRLHFNLEYDDILQHNINKLYSGKNARYSKGEFSNEQAQERADKKS